MTQSLSLRSLHREGRGASPNLRHSNGTKELLHREHSAMFARRLVGRVACNCNHRFSSTRYLREMRSRGPGPSFCSPQDPLATTVGRASTLEGRRLSTVTGTACASPRLHRQRQKLIRAVSSHEIASFFLRGAEERRPLRSRCAIEPLWRLRGDAGTNARSISNGVSCCLRGGDACRRPAFHRTPIVKTSSRARRCQSRLAVKTRSPSTDGGHRGGSTVVG